MICGYPGGRVLLAAGAAGSRGQVVHFRGLGVEQREAKPGLVWGGAIGLRERVYS